MTNDAECTLPPDERAGTAPPEYEPQPALGQRLRALRLRRGLSQSALAGDRVSPSAISLLESGHRQPTQRTLAYLAQQLGCTVEFLRDGVETTTGIALKLALARTELALLAGEAGTARSELSAVSGEDLSRFPGAFEQVTLLEALLAELSGDPGTALRLLENLTAAMPAGWRTDATSGDDTGPPEPGSGSGAAADEDSVFPCAPSTVFAALARCQRALGLPEAAARVAREGLTLLSTLNLADNRYS
ncbi:helix-turn-helix domain-containing protein, partial [Streptomyces sp. 8N706]|uniref:helix-turn-helix domain-containing protein n=1 Tax=Streptomyces sp. 8N706 TaxID=3457416 RepID=UPI003FCF15F8